MASDVVKTVDNPTSLAQPAKMQISRTRRWRMATWAPVLVLILLSVIITVINPNFLSFGNFVRISQAAMIPLVLGARRHVHHPHGFDRPLG